jgi:hypothetical protein
MWVRVEGNNFKQFYGWIVELLASALWILILKKGERGGQHSFI